MVLGDYNSVYPRLTPSAHSGPNVCTEPSGYSVQRPVGAQRQLVGAPTRAGEFAGAVIRYVWLAL